MAHKQIGEPLIVDGDFAQPLSRVPFGDRNFNEDYLQKLLFEHPQLLPTADLEPVFDDLVPVCRELPTPAGPLDLLYITPTGNLCLVETKLWRNPEARRTVVAQLIDYAKEVAGWSYGDLVDAVGRAAQVNKVKMDCDASENLDAISALVVGMAEDVDENDFIDAVSRNLRLGRFLLLIVGDGIREDVEQMSTFLQQTPQLGFTLGLIEVGLFRLEESPGSPIYVQPRVLARTVEVTRAVVEIRNRVGEQISVTAEVPEDKAGGGGTRVRPPITEDEFLEQLRNNAPPDAVSLAQWVLNNAEGQDLTIEWGAGGPLIKYVDDASGASFTFAQLTRRGELTGLVWLGRTCEVHRLPISIALDYLDELVECIPGATRYDDGVGGRYKAERHDVRMGPRIKKDRPGLELIAPNKEKWFGAISRAVQRIQGELDKRVD